MTRKALGVINKPTSPANKIDILEENFFKETVILGTYTNAAIPALNTTLISSGVRKIGGFNPWILTLNLQCSVDCEIEIQIKSFVGIGDKRGVSNIPLCLKAGVTTNITVNGQIKWGGIIFVVFKSSSATGAITLKMSYTGFETPNTLNLFGKDGFMPIGDSISYGADSTISADPDLSYASLLNKALDVINDELFLNKGIPGITTEDMQLAIASGYANTSKNIRLITIMLGTNTSTDDTVYTSSLRKITDYLMVRHPNANLLVLGPIMRADSSEPIIARYRTICENMVSQINVPSLKYKNLGTLGVLPGVTSVNVHPNNTGHQTMYTEVLNHLISLNWTKF